MTPGTQPHREQGSPVPKIATELNSNLPDLIETLPHGLILYDREWRIAYANREARRIGRILPEYLNGPTLWQLYPETIGTVFEDKCRRVMTEKTPEHLDFFYEPFQTWYRIEVRPTQDGVAVIYNDITSLRELEEVRDRANAQLKEVFDTTTDGVISLDHNWRFTFLNRRAIEITASSGDLLGENFWNRFPNAVYDDSPYVEHYFRTMIQRERQVFEAFYPAPLNQWFRIESLPSESGIIIFFRDITKERKDEEALRTSEQRYRVLTELNPQAIWTGTPDGRVNYANQRFLDYIGHEFVPEDGTEYLNCFALEDRGRVFQRWSHSVETGEEYTIDARLLRASDGAKRWWHLRALPLRDDSGNITLWLGVATDVHDQRTAAQTLQQEREDTEAQRAELEAIYRTAPVGLALFEPEDFRYLRVNDRQAETLGLPPNEIVGRKITDIISRTDLVNLFAGVVKGKLIRDYTYQTELKSRPGESRFFNVNYSPVFAADGSVRAISAAILDITQQKMAESALVQSEKLAAVGRLASSISHEINNPLEAITNLLYLTECDETLSPESRAYIHTAQMELARVSQIATQALRFHRQANSSTCVTPAQLIDAVLNLYQGRLTNSGIHVEASYSTAERIPCFENDIRQVLNNLIGNAIDAMRNGGRLRVRAHTGRDLATGRPGFRITVADTGHGMSRETASRVFDAFYTTKQLNGTGLGLWISAGIVDRHHGRLHVRSSEDPVYHGTVFTLFLPADEA